MNQCGDCGLYECWSDQKSEADYMTAQGNYHAIQPCPCESCKSILSQNRKDIISHTAKNGFFGTTLDCDDGRDCEKLVAAGYLIKRKAASWMGDDFIYYLTEKGRQVANG